MAYKIIITRAAREDLHNIGTYIERDNPKKAIEWVKLLKFYADSLREFPMRGKTYKKQYRLLTVDNGYQIYYRVNETKNEVIIYHFYTPYQNYN